LNVAGEGEKRNATGKNGGAWKKNCTFEKEQGKRSLRKGGMTVTWEKKKIVGATGKDLFGGNVLTATKKLRVSPSER